MAAALAVALLCLVGCVSTGRTTIPREESHYARTVQHELTPEVAFQRVEAGLTSSYPNLPQVLRSRQPDTGTFRLKPTVTYRTGGRMGSTIRAPYSLEVVVGRTMIEMRFDLGKDESTGEWAPATEIPYIRRAFEAVVVNVEEAVARP